MPDVRESILVNNRNRIKLVHWGVEVKHIIRAYSSRNPNLRVVRKIMLISSHRHEIFTLLSCDSHQSRCSNFQRIGKTFQRYTFTWNSVGNRVVFHVLQHDIVFVVCRVELTETSPSLSRRVVARHVHQEVPILPSEDKPVVVSLFNKKPVHYIAQLAVLGNID